MPVKKHIKRDSRAGGPTIATSVYDRLRADIIIGALEPGHRLGTDQLRGRYGVGISPVREALNRLLAEKLVCFEDQKGFHVAGIGEEDLHDLIRMRCWAEEIALRESMANTTPEWEESILLAYHRLSRTPRSAQSEQFEFNPEWEVLHREFHTVLLANCGSPRLLAHCELLADQSKRYRQLAASISYPARSEGDEHKSLMDKTLSGDADVAVAAHHDHLRKTMEIIIGSGLSLPTGKIAV
ncbi:MAG: GntR family transcriptional regulator [Alphaproteobacteria bacterium]